MKKAVKILKKAGVFVARVADNAVLGGAVTNVIEENQAAPRGRVDWARFLGTAIPAAVAVWAFASGKITIDDLGQVISWISELF